MLFPISLYIILDVLCASSSTGIDTSLSKTLDALSSSMVSQAPFEIVDPPLRRSTRICKSTKWPNSAYSCFSSSFTSFLSSIHCLSEPCSYKKAFLYPR